MKDYRLSEIKEICKSMTGDGGCLKCTLYPNVCLTTLGDVVPNKWDIAPRDMIELPCINEIDKSKTGCYTLDGKFYEVIFRDKDGSIKVEQAESKDEANKFLAMLKGSDK